MTMPAVRLLPMAVALAIAVSLPAAMARPTPVSASDGSSMAGLIVTLMNRDRGSLGLVALRTDPRLVDLATRRATVMASTGQLSHDSSGMSLLNAITLAGIKGAYLGGEVIGTTNATPGRTPSSSCMTCGAAALSTGT